MTRFQKMHGLGNDFVIFDAREAPLAMDAARARALADRRTGIGCDQLILLEPSDAADVQDADLEFRRRRGRGLRQCRALRRDPARRRLHDRDGGRPALRARRPTAPRRSTWAVRASAGTRSRSPMRWTRRRCRSAGRNCSEPFAVNVGNPHVVFFVGDADKVDARPARPADRARPALPGAGQRQRRRRSRARRSACASGSAAPA